jgi:hypothetical protein
MPRLPSIGIGLAGLAVFVLALLTLVQGQEVTLTQPETAPAETPAAEGDGTSDGEQTVPEDPDSIVRVHPDKVVIQGEKWGLRDVAYDHVPLTVWLTDLTADGETNGEQDGDAQQPPPDLSWSPVSAGDGSVPLKVDQINTGEDSDGPCAGARSIPNDRDPPSCYTVGLEDSKRLPAGTYGATIYVGDGPDARRSIPVEVLVGRPLFWLIGIVALGVIATELLIWWREGAYYMRGWQVRRAKWLDWLSENLGWTRPYERPTEREEVERTVLRIVKGSLRERVDGVRTWLDRGTKGETTIAQVPANLDAARDMVYPLRLERERYVTDPASWWSNRLDRMERYLSDLGQKAIVQSKGDLGKAHETLSQMQGDPVNRSLASSYKALEEWWKRDPKTVDKKLAEAWVAIRDLWKKAEELKTEAPTRPVLPDNGTAPADITAAAEAISGYLSKLRADVFSKARATLDTLKEIPPDAPGQKETVDFLDKVVARIPDLDRADQAVDRANHPLKFAGPESEVGKKLEKLRRDLQAVDGQVDDTRTGHLTEDAVRTTVLKPVREQLESTETKFNDSSQDIKQRWVQVRLNYHQNQHFVRIGQKISKQCNRFAEYVQQFGAQFEERLKSEADRSLKSAYRYLLDGKALDAEVELERAKYSLDEAYQGYIGAASFSDWRNRVTARVNYLWESASAPLVHAFKRTMFSPARPILVVTVVSLPIVLWLLRSRVLPNVKASETTPSSDPWNRLPPVILESIGFILKNPVMIGILLAILIFAAFYIREQWENFWPFTVRLFLGAMSGFLSLIIAVTVILAYQKTVPKEQFATWGTNLDLVVAFALGVLAHRAVQALTSASESLTSFVKGEEEKPSAPAETATEEKDSIATTPAKPAAGTG